MDKNLHTHTARKTRRQPAAGLPMARTNIPAKKQASSRKPKNLLRHVLYQDHFQLLPRFAESMRQIGVSIDISRMHFDRIYGMECLHQAHAQSDATLRQLAAILMLMYAIR